MADLSQARRKEQVRIIEVINQGDKIILPDGPPPMGVPQAIKELQRLEEFENTVMAINAEISGFPLDAAHAFNVALTRKYGWVNGVPTPGFFGARPPMLKTIKTGPKPEDFVQVPLGRIELPNVEGYLQTAFVPDAQGVFRFVIAGEVKRRYEDDVNKIIALTRDVLSKESVYRGKAMRIRTRNDYGELLELPEPQFFERNPNLREELFFSQEVMDNFEINVLTLIEHREQAREQAVPGKRGILFAGPYGTGKSMASAVIANVCVENGTTFLMCERVTELADVLRIAVDIGGPVVLFTEDIDRIVQGERSLGMDEVLNIVDGVESKNNEIMVVMTTNHVDQIHPAMLRPGRLDAVINVLPPDAETVEKLFRHYSRGRIPASENLTEAAELMAGNIPAVIREVVERSKLAAIRRSPTNPDVIRADDLVKAANSMRNQMELLRLREPDKRSNYEKGQEAHATILAQALRETHATGYSNGHLKGVALSTPPTAPKKAVVAEGNLPDRFLNVDED